MTLKQIWEVSPQSFIYVREGGKVVEYNGDSEMGRRTIANMKATSYPMFKSVIEVELDEDVVIEKYKYEIIYDWCGEYSEERNLTEVFEGTWTELKKYLKEMRENGCYNISANCITQELHEISRARAATSPAEGRIEMYELVAVYNDGNKDIYEYGTKEAAERGADNIRMAAGNQVSWTGIRMKQENTPGLRNWLEKAVGHRVVRTIGVGSKRGRKIYEVMYTNGQCEDWYIDYEKMTAEIY